MGTKSIKLVSVNIELAKHLGLIGRVEYTKAPFVPYGVGILSALPVQSVRRAYYSGNEEVCENA